MTIRKNSIVIRKDSEGYSGTHFRVENVDDDNAVVRDLETYQVTVKDIHELEVLYQVDPFEPGDIVRVRGEYVSHYNEADGCNELKVVSQKTGQPPTTVVENNCGTQFAILTERIFLVRPAVGFKAGDKVVIDFDRAKTYSGEGILGYWTNAGVMTLTEDSGSRYVQTTSNVQYESDSKENNNVPTRWLKLYVEPAKRVVGETIKTIDIKVGDKIKASYTVSGLLSEFTGTVGNIYDIYGGKTIRAEGGGVFPFESKGAVFTLLEEAPEPVDENLQRLLDAEIGEIAYGTYANEYWIKVGDDEWQMIDGGRIRTTDEVFGYLYKLKYGKLEIYRKVESDN